MAYIKYKELTKYYNFSKELKINEIPEKVFLYIEPNEEILLAYSTYNDTFIMTNLKIMVFDVSGITDSIEKIHFFPFSTISSTAIEMAKGKSSIYLSMDSGYQVQLNFVKMVEEEHIRMKKAHMKMVSEISKPRYK